MRVRDKYTGDFSEPHLRDRTSEPHLRDLEILEHAKTQHAGVAFSILPNDNAHSTDERPSYFTEP